MEQTTELVCVECRRPWTEPEERWQALRVDLEEVAFYCPQCAEREFSE